ncbi:hypothetical protein C8J57DRAFT_734582 [Mycena rebaudengoi]|nr:hypothetical protein C8J57DRAFT_734582 [Mycena rebaudengoi]
MRQAVRTSLSPSSHSGTSTISDFSPVIGPTSPSTNSLYRTSTTLEFSSIAGQADCTSQSSNSHSRTSTISELSPVVGQADLVSPSPSPSRTSTILEFSSHDSLKSNQLSLHGKPLYRFTRAKGLIVKRAEDSTLDTPVATLVQGDIAQPAKITLRGRETVRVDRWLCSAGKFSILPATFLENGEVWTWKMNNLGQLSLWLGGQQMAWWQRPVLREQILPLPYLGLEDVAVRIQDVVVVSFMVLMQRLRSSAKTKDQVVLGAQLLGASLKIVNSVLGVVL